MKVSLLGGVPPVLGGGGLEVQIRETERALSDLQVEIIDPWQPGSSRPDLLHIFGADPATWNWVRNARQPLPPYVISPVLVLSSRRTPFVERVQGRTSALGASAATMRRTLIRDAGHVVALTTKEKEFLVSAYGIGASRVSVVGNGSSAIGESRVASDKYAIAVGTIGDRKGQLELARSWPTSGPLLLLCGPLQSRWSRADEFVRCAASNPRVHWAGEVAQRDLWSLQAGALATISWSSVEGESLALLDSLRLSRPVVLRRSASAATFASRYPRGVELVDSVTGVVSFLERGGVEVRAEDRPQSWTEVALELLKVYVKVCG